MKDDVSLGEALPAEIKRVRDKLIPAYLECGPGGMFAVLGMRADLDRATKAMIEGDVVAMIAAYQALKGWKL